VLRIKKKKVIAVIVSICMMLSMMSGLVFTASAAAPTTQAEAIAFIVDYASNNGQPTPTDLTFTILNLAGATTDAVAGNESKYQTAFAAKSASAVGTAGEILGVVTKVNADVALADAIVYINGFTFNRGAKTDITISKLNAAGVTATVTGTLVAYQDAIAAKPQDSLDTTLKIQAVIDSVNLTAINKIIAFAYFHDASTMVIKDLTDAGVIRIVDGNLAAYQTAIGTSVDVQVNTTVKIQKIVDDINLNAAINVIKGYAGKTNTALITDLVAAGVTVETALVDNLGAYRLKIAGVTAADVSSTTLIQDLVTGVNTAEALKALTAGIEVIKGYAADKNADGLNTTQLIAAGVTIVSAIADTANMTKYKAAIAAATPTQVNSAFKIQEIVTNANTAVTNEAVALAAAIKVIRDYAANKDASSLNILQLLAVGVTADTALIGNLAAYKTKIAGAAANLADSTSEIQNLVNTANSDALAAGIAVIKAYADTGDASAMIIAELEVAGILPSTLSIANIDAYKLAIQGATITNTGSIQTIIGNTNIAQADLTAAIVVIQGYALSSAAAMSNDELINAGVTVTIPDDAHLNAYKAAIGAKTAAQLDTKGKIQKIINDVNIAQALIAAINVIKAHADNVGAVTIAELTAANVTAISDNLLKYVIAIGAKTAAELDSTDKIQRIIYDVDDAEVARVDAIATIRGFAANRDASGLSILMLTTAGVTTASTLVPNLAAYERDIALAPASAADSTSDIQLIVTNTNTTESDTILPTIKTYINNNAGALTTDQLIVALKGDSSIANANLTAYKAAIGEKTLAADIDYIKLGTIITTVNSGIEQAAIEAAQAAQDAAVLVIKNYAANRNANALYIPQLTAAGVDVSVDGLTGSIEANLAAYRTYIANSAASALDTSDKIIAFIALKNTAERTIAINTIKGYATAGDASALTIDLLASAGVVGAIQSNLAAYIAAIAAVTAVDVESTSKIQGIIGAKNLIAASVATISGYATNHNASALIPQLLANAGVSANAANLAAYIVAIAGSTATLTDTAAKIQKIIGTVDAEQIIVSAVNVIKAYINTAATDLTNQQLINAGVTGSVDDFANGPYATAYKTAIGAKTLATDLDSKDKIQEIITAQNAAVLQAAKDAAANSLAVAVAVITAYAADKDATGLNNDELIAAEVTSINDVTHLVAYKVAIEDSTAALTNLTAKIQKIIDDVNVALGIDVIKAYATAHDATNLTIAELEAAGVTDAAISSLPSYKAEIAAATDVSTTALIQDIVDAINTAATNATITGVPVGTVSGDIPDGSTDPLYVATFTVTIDPSVTAITPSDFTVADAATLTLYATSNFTGSVSSVAISGNSTTLYAKIVSQDGTVSKYFKVIFNVVDPSQTDYTFAPVGTPVSTPFGNVSTISLNAGAAKTGSDVVVLAVYTTLSGDQAIVMESIVNGQITVSEPTGNFISVDLYVFDTITGDFYGISNNVQFGGIV
jgi:hypothetical protein